MKRTRLLNRTIIAGGMCAMLLPLAATGQENTTAYDVADQSAEDQQVTMGSVLVTTRKREESLQDVPVAISAYTDEQLRDANIFSIEDLAATTPGLAFTNVGTLGTPIIRGLAQTDLGGAQTNVGVFLDGVYINNRSALEFGNMDLAQIEVAKGPQSALFGRDSFAGAINYITREAVIGDFDAFIQAEAGTEDRLGLKASVNLPLGDKAALRIFGGTSEFDGTIKNSQGGQNLGGWDKRQSIGGSLLFEPTERFSLKLFSVKNEVEEDQPPLVVLPFSANSAGAQYTNANGTFFTLFEGDIPEFDTVSLDNRGSGNAGDVTLSYLKASYDFDAASLTFLGAYTESGFDGFYDNVADTDAVNRSLAGPASAFFFSDIAGDGAEQTSYELNLASNGEGPFEWLVGGSYYDTSTTLQTRSFSAIVGDIDTLVQISDFNETLDQEIFAAYASVGYDISDQVTIGGEIRYTEEEQILDVLQDFILFNIVLADTEEATEFDYFSGRGTIEYRPNANTMLYASAARGVKTGGINGGREDLDFFTFDPETNWTYEIGSKSTLLDGRMRLNTALFFVDWSDLQSTAPGDLTSATATVNGTGATSTGIEIDGSLDITENLAWQFAGTIVDPKYDDGFIDGAFEDACLDLQPGFVSSTCTGDVSGNRISKTSEIQLYSSLTHTVPELIQGFDLINRIDVSHEGDRPTSSIGTATIPAVTLTNYRLSLKNGDTEISFWVDNLFDESWVGSVLPTSSIEANTPTNCSGCSVRIENVYPGNGRFMGITLAKQF